MSSAPTALRVAGHPGRKEGNVATSLIDVPKELASYFDALDFDGIRSLMSHEVEGVDEISRGWLRGRDGLDAYLRQLQEMGLASVQSVVSDVHTREWGDVGLITFVLDQRYEIEGQAQHIHAPASVVCRRDGREWRIELVHAVPLPEQG